MLRFTSTRAILVALALTLAALAPATALADSSDAAPQAQAAKGCSIKGKEQKLGATYVYTLRVKGTSCANGKTVLKAYHSCRKNGKGKRCRKKVKGYKCSERRSNVISTQYDAKVTCKKGGRAVSFTYTQNT